jgi:hypothetical protein
MTERLYVREISNDEGNRLLKIVRRSSGSVVTWRRAQMVLLSAQRMDVAKIANIAFTSPDRVREVIRNVNPSCAHQIIPGRSRYGGWQGASPFPVRAKRNRLDLDMSVIETWLVIDVMRLYPDRRSGRRCHAAGGDHVGSRPKRRTRRNRRDSGCVQVSA